MAYELEPGDLLALFRSSIDDVEPEYLWSDSEAYGYMDDAQKEFARLTDCFATTATVAVTADDGEVAISDRYTKIRNAKLVSTGKPLTITSYDNLEEIYQADDYGNFGVPLNWEALTGTPTILITDWEQDKGRLVKIPVDDDTLTLRVYRLPLTDIEDGGSEFELTDARHQRALLYWMKKLAYEKHDSQTYNPNMAREEELKFLSYCDSAKDQYRRLRRRAGTVSYGGL